MDILEQFKHVESFQLMDMGEKLLATGYVILLGMFVTFVGLILIMYLTMFMSKIIMAFENSRKKPLAVKANAPAAPVAQPVASQDEMEDDALVAVITAAIAASLNTSMHNIVVSSIKRIPDTTPVWGQSGRGEVMAARIK